MLGHKVIDCAQECIDIFQVILGRLGHRGEFMYFHLYRASHFYTLLPEMKYLYLTSGIKILTFACFSSIPPMG